MLEKPPPSRHPVARLIVGAILAASAAAGYRLPVRIYTTLDGLPLNTIKKILSDKSGALWFATDQGIARFDGLEFSRFGTAEGLVSERVNGLAQTPDGSLWAASGRGLYRFAPEEGPSGRFLRGAAGAPEEDFEEVAVDQSGILWAGSEHGLWRVLRSGASWVAEEVRPAPSEGFAGGVSALAPARDGGIWVGTMQAGLYRIVGRSATEHYAVRDGLPSRNITSILEEQDGAVEVGTTRGLVGLEPAPTGKRRAIPLLMSADGVRIRTLLRDRLGRLWAGTSRGLAHRGSDGRWEIFGKANGLADSEVTALALDSGGNVWVGTESGGACRIAAYGFLTFSQDDGLDTGRVAQILRDSDGALCVVTTGDQRMRVHRLQPDGRFRPYEIRYGPDPQPPFSWGRNQILLHARDRRWWVPTQHGLYRFPPSGTLEGLMRSRPEAHYGRGNGLAGNDIYAIFEDGRGDVWISNTDAGSWGLAVWRCATGEVIRVGGEAPWAGRFTDAPSSFGADRSGNVWIGSSRGQLARCRNGQFDFFGEADGVPAGQITSIYSDLRGALWISSTRGGVARIENPSADRPTVAPAAGGDLLSSRVTYCFAEDEAGGLYVGTAAGVDRIDLIRGTVRRFTAVDGLPTGVVQEVLHAEDGSLWFGTLQGLARLPPGAPPSGAGGSVYVRAISVGGRSRRLSPLGERRVSGLRMTGPSEPLDVQYSAIDFRPGLLPQFEYRMDGGAWRRTRQRSLTFVALPEGRHRIEIRSLESAGQAARPAVVEVEVLPPFWRRGWFLLLAGAAVASAAFAGHRIRVSQILRLERVRAGIARDLHDDVGAGLSRVAILSEVLGKGPAIGPKEAGLLREIASTSRELIAAMSDIVWANDPRNDSLASLVARLREFAEDIFPPLGIDHRFWAPADLSAIPVNSDRRRDLFLILKEAIHNAARHGKPSRVEIAIELDGRSLFARVEDDGSGFDTSRRRSGHGLGNMRARAERLRAAFEIASTPGNGTRVELRAEL